VLAAALLVGRQVAVHLALPAATVEQILTATGATKSRAYELAAALAGVLPTLTRGRGRPPATPSAHKEAEGVAALTRTVLDYVMRHPGCVDRGPVRQRYSDDFRHFILELRGSHPDVGLEVFAQAVQVPLPTLKDWLRDPTPRPAVEPTVVGPRGDEDAQILTVVQAWTRWSGCFRDFCAHVQRDLRIPFSPSLIGRILHLYRARKITRRTGRGPDELALRGAFRTFFPGAQWVGDGMQVPVVVDGARFTVNVELDVDAYSGAFVGLSVRNEEDSAAVIEAFESGVTSTGAPPLALLLDNRPSNHTPEVDDALASTLRIRATTERPQNKAHVEGAFGLFSQILPALDLDTTQRPRELAASLVRLVAEVWARASNHRPRNDRDGRSRIDLYADSPSTEQIEQALHDLRELKEQQERARRTREARRRPEVLSLLDEQFKRLALLDPERHVRIAIARYPLSAIVDAIAIFDAKQCAGTLPAGVDARYLLGIVRNVAAEAEGEALARRLLELRLEVRDRMLLPLVAARDALCAGVDLAHVTRECVDRALATPSPLDRTFWLDALADVLVARGDADREALYRAAARRIEATFSIKPRERHEAVRRLAARLHPLE
jgi:hypothetical protein